MRELADLFAAADAPVSVAAVHGVIANTPATLTSDLFVTVASFDGGRQQWGPCAWIPSNAMPKRGQDCLVVFDERDTPWVLVLTQLFGGKPHITGSRAGNAALASLLTHLETIGLIVDDTT